MREVRDGSEANDQPPLSHISSPIPFLQRPSYCNCLAEVWTNLRALVKRSATLLRDILPVALGSLVSVHCLLKQDAPQSRPGDAAEASVSFCGLYSDMSCRSTELLFCTNKEH